MVPKGLICQRSFLLLVGKSKRNVQILNTIEDLLTLDMNESYMKIIKTIVSKYHKYSSSYGIDNIGGIMILMMINNIRTDIPTSSIKESIVAIIENQSKYPIDTSTTHTNTNNNPSSSLQQDIMDDPIIRVFGQLSHNEDVSQSTSVDFRKSKSIQPAHSLSIDRTNINKSRQITSSRVGLSSSLTFQTPNKAMKLIREKAADSVSVLNLMSGGKKRDDEQSLEIFRLLGLIDIHYMEDMEGTGGAESDFESDAGGVDHENGR